MGRVGRLDYRGTTKGIVDEMGGRAGELVLGLAGVLSDLFVLETEIRCHVAEPFMRGGDSVGGAACVGQREWDRTARVQY